LTPADAAKTGASGPGAVRRPASLWRVSFGDAALAAFVLCAISGALLVPGFDTGDGARSIAEWLLANPGATFLRNLHYWTAQAFLVLTLLHGWDHLRRGTEVRLRRGVWLRLVASLPVLAFLMLSGFLLRADADAQQARRIFEEVVHWVPLAGPLLATFLFGADEGSLQVLYLHHAATATLIVWLVIIDHARRRWGTPRAWLLVALSAGVLALLVSPGLHDGRDPVVKGPWYFLGLQEGLHWTPWPLLALGLAAAALLFVWWIPRWTPPVAARAKRGLFAVTAGYFVLCLLALFMRGENWSLQAEGPVWPAGPGDLQAGPIGRTARIDPQDSGAAPIEASVGGVALVHQPDETPDENQDGRDDPPTRMHGNLLCQAASEHGGRRHRQLPPEPPHGHSTARSRQDHGFGFLDQVALELLAAIARHDDPNQGARHRPGEAGPEAAFVRFRGAHGIAPSGAFGPALESRDAPAHAIECGKGILQGPNARRPDFEEPPGAVAALAGGRAESRRDQALLLEAIEGRVDGPERDAAV